jgi:hypothetical protein
MTEGQKAVKEAKAGKIRRKLTGKMLKTTILNNLAGVVMVNYSDTVSMIDAQSCLTAIQGDRSDPQGTLTVVPDKKGPVDNGDISLFSFLDDTGDCKFMMRKYIYKTDHALDNTIMDAQGDWDQEIAVKKWSKVFNCHSMLTYNQHFYGGGYDQGKVIMGVMSGDNAYAQGKVYDFAQLAAAAVPNSTDNTDSSCKSVFHVENLAVMDGMMYVQMDVNIVPKDKVGDKNEDYNVFADAYVVQASINSRSGELEFQKAVRTGKNALSMDSYGSTLYCCCAGGKQMAGSQTQAAGLYMVQESASGKLLAQEAVMPDNFTVDDIRDLSITPYDRKTGTGSAETDDNVWAFIMAGHYGIDYLSFSGTIYRTPLSNLSAPHPEDWEVVQRFTGTGYFWAIHAADNGRFWFIKGDRIQVFQDSSQITADTPPEQEFTQSDLTSHSDYKHINSVCFFPPDQTKEAAAEMRLKGLRTKRFKYMNGHLRLAREAFRLAQEAQAERQDPSES